jgi:uncharacterized protein YhhL (DUF1145 family)
MTQYEIYQLTILLFGIFQWLTVPFAITHDAVRDLLTILLFGIFQWLTVPFAITHDAVRDLSTNYSTVWYFSLVDCTLCYNP